MKRKSFAVAESLTASDIKAIRKKQKLTQTEFAELVNVSKKTIERWENSTNEITGPIVTLVKLMNENIDIVEELKIPEKKYPLRLTYMFRNQICTIIDVDERERRVKIYNYTNKLIFRAFGKIEKPTYEQYEEFLESRCFPRTRDKMKIILQELDIPFYDPYMIVEKTQGRMVEDDFWIDFER